MFYSIGHNFSFQNTKENVVVMARLCDCRCNDTQYNGTQHIDSQHNDTMLRRAQHNSKKVALCIK
jgi:hypothetical protein